MKKTYTKIEGKNLIEGHIYYTDGMGMNKVIYEGRMKEDIDKCILKPIGFNSYQLYNESHYKGEYAGKYTLGTGAYYYELLGSK